tara:strand:+ start:1133 stop:1870 length:738 start_codon:yes stop_codon:yes gene_type:complete
MIKERKIKFFNPNTITNWRLDTFYIKEPETLNWIREFDDTKKNTFWDIGSNIGLYSIYAAIIHNNIKIISFEPSLSNLNILSKNISLNRLNNKIDIAQFALTEDTNKFLTMKESSNIEGGALNAFGVNYDGDGNQISINNEYNIFGTSINFLLSQNILEIPNYIKIDVDGIEHLIIKGGDKFLSNSNIKSVLVELNEGFQDQAKLVKEALKSHGFKLKLKTRSQMVENDHPNSEIYNFIFSRDLS